MEPLEPTKLDAAVDRNFTRLRRLTSALGPLSGSLDIIQVTLATGDNTIEHGLGRTPEGRIIVAQDAAADLYDKAHTNPARYVTLNASGPVTVKLLFF
jgi:hypothetical protein